VWLTDVERIEDTWFVVDCGTVLQHGPDQLGGSRNVTKKPFYAAATEIPGNSSWSAWKA
jgi:hypothetical protein